jgi:hypothetical protein
MIITPIQIRFSDMDPMQRVNNSVYSSYLELGRLDFCKKYISIKTLLPEYTYAEIGDQYGVDYMNLVDPTATINYITYNRGDGLEVSNATTISNKNIDYARAMMPSVFSNKLFGCIGYNWKECCTEPFILVAGEVEFAQDNRTFSQWGIILKGGITY